MWNVNVGQMGISEQEERFLLERYRQNMRRTRQILNSKGVYINKNSKRYMGALSSTWRHATGAVPDIYHHTASDPTWINTTTPMAGIPRYRYRSTSNVDVKSGRASGRIRPPTADPGDTVARHDPLPPTEERMAQRLALHKSRHKKWPFSPHSGTYLYSLQTPYIHGAAWRRKKNQKKKKASLATPHSQLVPRDHSVSHCLCQLTQSSRCVAPRSFPVASRRGSHAIGRIPLRH